MGEFLEFGIDGFNQLLAVNGVRSRDSRTGRRLWASSRVKLRSAIGVYGYSNASAGPAVRRIGVGRSIQVHVQALAAVDPGG